jgi:hypothetical protein
MDHSSCGDDKAVASVSLIEDKRKPLFKCSPVFFRFPDYGHNIPILFHFQGCSKHLLQVKLRNDSDMVLGEKKRPEPLRSERLSKLGGAEEVTLWARR